jgi:hypothetical protein
MADHTMFAPLLHWRRAQIGRLLALALLPLLLSTASRQAIERVLSPLRPLSCFAPCGDAGASRCRATAPPCAGVALFEVVRSSGVVEVDEKWAQVPTNGARCWTGPRRRWRKWSLVVTLAVPTP